MLSNFTNKKPEGSPVAQSPQTSPPGLPPQGAAARAPMARAGERSAQSLIGPDMTLTGNILSKGEVQIEGEVQGDLHAVHVIVGERARITGNIVADEVVVRGHVSGSVRGKKVVLQTSSHVEGDIYHQSLAIEQGAFFEGKSRRAEDPTAAGIASDTPRPAPMPAAG
jgi:cytoskeletal protein CcmA (bactofilin family)